MAERITGIEIETPAHCRSGCGAVQARARGARVTAVGNLTVATLAEPPSRWRGSPQSLNIMLQLGPKVRYKDMREVVDGYPVHREPKRCWNPARGTTFCVTHIGAEARKRPEDRRVELSANVTYAMSRRGARTWIDPPTVWRE